MMFYKILYSISLYPPKSKPKLEFSQLPNGDLSEVALYSN